MNKYPILTAMEAIAVIQRHEENTALRSCPGMNLMIAMSKPRRENAITRPSDEMSAVATPTSATE